MNKKRFLHLLGEARVKLFLTEDLTPNPKLYGEIRKAICELEQSPKMSFHLIEWKLTEILNILPHIKPSEKYPDLIQHYTEAWAILYTAQIIAKSSIV